MQFHALLACIVCFCCLMRCVNLTFSKIWWPNSPNKIEFVILCCQPSKFSVSPRFVELAMKNKTLQRCSMHLRRMDTINIVQFMYVKWRKKTTGWFAAFVRVTTLKLWFSKPRYKTLVFVGLVKKCYGHSFRLAGMWPKCQTLRFACAVNKFCSSTDWLNIRCFSPPARWGLLDLC